LLLLLLLLPAALLVLLLLLLLLLCAMLLFFWRSRAARLACASASAGASAGARRLPGAAAARLGGAPARWPWPRAAGAAPRWLSGGGAGGAPAGARAAGAAEEDERAPGADEDTTLADAYTALVASGAITSDKAQLRVVRSLQRVYSALAGHRVPGLSLLEARRAAEERAAATEAARSSPLGLLRRAVDNTRSVTVAFGLGSLMNAMRAGAGAPSGGGAPGGAASPPDGAPDGAALHLSRAELLSRPDLVAIDGVLYDLQRFIPRHPGGKIALNLGGQDASAVFVKMHTEAICKKGRKVLEKYRVGELTDAAGAAAATPAAEVAVEELFPRGLYIYGGPGCGKTFLMDAFFQALPLASKRRVHLHQFMMEVHQQQHRLKDAGLGNAVFLKIADDVAQRHSVLCLDEFMVTDVADAMVIGELFRALWRAGVVVVATSNRRPDELYNNGIQRRLFLPFVKELERRCKVVRLRSDKDYRMEIMQRNSAAAVESRAERGPQSSRSRFFAVRARAGVAVNDSNPAFGRLWAAYTAGLHVERKAFVLGHGRRVPLRACEELNALRIDFQQLCGETEQPMGVADYLAIATEFDAVFVDALPMLDLADLDVMRRWISFIDVLYDEKVLLVADAERAIDELLLDPSGGSLSPDELAKRMLKGKADIMGDEYLAQTVHDADNPGTVAYHTIAAQESLDEIFAFNRMRSRLHEMQTDEYLARCNALDKHRLAPTAIDARAAAPATA
jgi:predicted ATPase